MKQLKCYLIIFILHYVTIKLLSLEQQLFQNSLCTWIIRRSWLFSSHCDIICDVFPVLFPVLRWSCGRMMVSNSGWHGGFTVLKRKKLEPTLIGCLLRDFTLKMRCQCTSTRCDENTLSIRWSFSSVWPLMSSWFQVLDSLGYYFDILWCFK